MPAEERKIVREMRAQAAGTDAKGGYLVPEGFQAELVKSLAAWGPMLDAGVARIITTASGNSIPWPTMNDTSNKGALIAENTQVSESEVAFGTKTLEAYKYTSGVVLVSAELLQDSALDVEQIVRDAMSERIGRIGNEHLTIGDGTNKPNGVATAAGTKAAAAAAAISLDDMIELEHSVDPAYRSDPSVRWMFNDSTLKALRKIKDLEGNYIWQPADAKAGAPATIMNYAYSINQAMDSVAASQRSVLFGAFNRYVVRMVREFAIRRLVERYADFDQTGFIGFTRLDGELLDAGAIKALAHPAS
jgi:HK97 family phage major capsid protein